MPSEFNDLGLSFIVENPQLFFFFFFFDLYSGSNLLLRDHLIKGLQTFSLWTLHPVSHNVSFISLITLSF